MLGKPTKEMTEEMLLKKSEKNRKRRLQALKRKEKDKVCVLFASYIKDTRNLTMAPQSLFTTACYLCKIFK